MIEMTPMIKVCLHLCDAYEALVSAHPAMPAGEKRAMLNAMIDTLERKYAVDNAMDKG